MLQTFRLTVNSIWGKKIREKNRQDNFSQVLLKSSRTTFQTIFSSGGLPRDHYWIFLDIIGIQEIHDFQGFWSISQQVFDIYP